MRRIQSGQYDSELAQAGITAREAQLRLAAATDSELKQAQQSVHPQAGGDVIVISVGTVLLALLIYLILR